jgi:cytochrome c551/c552
MAQKSNGWRSLGWPVYLALALLVVGVIALVVAVATSHMVDHGAPEPVSAASYRARVDALLEIGKPADAEAVVTKYGCVACHRDGANTVAPSWVGVAERAGARRPPMPADAYIYESIVYPAAYVVEGYPDLMPKDFAQRLSDQELADVLAFLLTPDAH